MRLTSDHLLFTSDCGILPLQLFVCPQAKLCKHSERAESFTGLMFVLTSQHYCGRNEVIWIKHRVIATEAITTIKLCGHVQSVLGPVFTRSAHSAWLVTSATTNEGMSLGGC